MYTVERPHQSLIPSNDPGVTTSIDLCWNARSLPIGTSSRGVMGRTALRGSDDADGGLPPDVELIEDERGFTLICRSSDAAVSSSGVHVGDTVGEAETDFRCCCCCRAAVELPPDAFWGSGCAGAGRASEGMFARVIAGRKRPEGGGEGSWAFAGERAGTAFGDFEMRVLGS